MPITKTLCLILLLPSLATAHAQQPNSHACKGSTVDTFDPATAGSSRSFVVELQRLVKNGEKQAIAARVDYPLRINRTVDGRLTHTIIPNRQQFVAAYDRLFNDKVRAAILNPDSVRCLFANDQGFMIGNGQLWFRQTASKTFRISALNP